MVYKSSSEIEILDYKYSCSQSHASCVKSKLLTKYKDISKEEFMNLRDIDFYYINRVCSDDLAYLIKHRDDLRRKAGLDELYLKNMNTIHTKIIRENMSRYKRRIDKKLEEIKREEYVPSLQEWLGIDRIKK